MKKTSTILAILLVLLAFTSCHKDKEFGNEKPEIGEVVVTPALSQVDFTWKVVYPGKFQTGVEISDNEDMESSRTVEGTKDGEVFKASVNQLEASTTYYYRIVVWNKMSRQEGEVKSFTTLTPDPEPDVYTITVSANPEEGGTVTGGGEYVADSICTVKATANEGYTFVNWTKGNTGISTESSITFNVTESATYVAHFQKKSYTVEVSANPTEGGTVSGGGTFNDGDNCTLTATANAGYDFDHWMKDGTMINGDATISFTVTANASYVAYFTPETYTISTQSNPSNGGTVSGGGDYIYGQTCTVTATPANGYTFDSWTENGQVVAEADTSYTFTVTGNRILVADFQTTVQTFTVNGVSFTMKRVEGGTFWMGAQSTNPNGQNYDSEAYGEESPVHSVTLSTFYMGETEVTQELWQAVMGANPSSFTGTNLPVEMVSWNMIVNEFLPALNAATGQNFRLPTESEWEYAARGGNQGHGCKYAGSNTIGNVAWSIDNSNSQTHSVATKSPNELGLYDMSGNVFEWCSDWYSNYSSGSQTNPTGPLSGSYRVLRGGSWSIIARGCRVSNRSSRDPDNRYFNGGFRLCLPQ